jgi:hypothetical protein
MKQRSFLALVIVAAVQPLGLLPLWLLHPLDFQQAEYVRELLIGILLGCAFSQASLAATWMALGPLPLVIRFPGSLLWSGVAAATLIFNIIRSAPAPVPSSEHWRVAGDFSAAFLVLWLLVQTPLWIARWVYRFRVESSHQAFHDAERKQLQFGIRQLLIVTAAVAITLGWDGRGYPPAAIDPSLQSIHKC